MQVLRSFGLQVTTALLLGTALTGHAAAFELFGHKFFEKKPDPTDVAIGEPQNYSVDFNIVGDGDDVESKLKSVSTLWDDREKPASGASGLLVKARGDYRRLLGLLYTEGRYGPVISIKIDGREASDLAPDATLANPAKIVVTVNPGPSFTFSRAEIVNAPAPNDDHRHHLKTPQEIGFMQGATARSGVILAAEQISVEGWRRQGYAKAKVAERQVEADHATDSIASIITMDAGRHAKYGALSVQGTARMDPDFIAYMTDLPRGKDFDPDDLKRAGDRLARLEVFRSQRIEEGEEIDENGELPLAVILQERAPRRFGIGATYSTLDGAGVEGFWMHRNLFGRGERLRFDAKIAGVGLDVLKRNGDEVKSTRFDPAAFTYRLGATFIKPGVFTPDTDFVSSLFGDREVLDAYTRTAITAQVGFNRIFSEELSGSLFLSGGPSRYDDDFGTREFVTAGLPAKLVYDTRDNKTNATSGYMVEAMVEPFFEFHYGNAVGRATVEGRTYYAFGESDRLVAAGRLKLGSIVGATIAELPPDKLFFAGGGGSVRGYAYRNIGVEHDGRLEGGRSLIEASAELRMRVTDSIGVVGFVDGGYVSADTIPSFSENLKLGAGVGLRYLTGLGPIRADIAMPLNPGPRDPSFAFYVGIGQSF